MMPGITGLWEGHENLYCNGSGTALSKLAELKEASQLLPLLVPIHRWGSQS